MSQLTTDASQGNSGGALISASDGSLLGLVTSNARHVSGHIIPTLNFSLPVNMLSGVNLFHDDELLAKERLNISDEDLSDIWKLEPPPFDITINDSVLASSQELSMSDDNGAFRSKL